MKNRVKKTGLYVFLMLITSMTHAEIVLTVNGVNVSEHSFQQPDIDELMLCIEGEISDDIDYQVKVVFFGSIEEESKPEYSSQIITKCYAFKFEQELDALSVVDLYAEGEHVYELFLSRDSKTGITTAIGIGYDILHSIQLEQAADTVEEPSVVSTFEYEEPLPVEVDEVIKVGPDALLKNLPLKQVVPTNLLSPDNSNVDNHGLYPPEELIVAEDEESGGVETLDSGQTISEITTSCILDPGVDYYVANPPLLIHGDIDVVIPSGTTITLAEDWDYGIVIYDGANVHFGGPEPQSSEPADILPPGNTNNPVEPVYIIGESGNPFFNNYCGILIDRTASTRCVLNNIVIKNAYYAILADQQLEQSISNIYVSDCYCGVFSFGSNQIKNSYVKDFGEWSAGWQYYGQAFCFIPESMDQTIQFDDPNFVIQNSLADSGDDGFTVYGSTLQADAPYFYAYDCVASNCQSGFNGWDGYIVFSLLCPGLYNNSQNKNFPEMPFTYPVYETSNPLVIEPSGYRIFLNPTSQFVNNGSGLSPFLGWTTRLDCKPDDNLGDIWLHYQTGMIDCYPLADLDADGTVDISDLSEFVQQWLIPSPTLGDFDDNGTVNLIDYTTLVNQWGENGMSVEMLSMLDDTEINVNDVQGDFWISLKNYPANTAMVSLYLDNYLVDDLNIEIESEMGWLSLESDKYLNGWHFIRIVTTDYYGNIINHKPIKVCFNNLLYNVYDDDYFYPGDDYPCRGFYDGALDLDATLADMNDQTIWSDTYSGTHVNIVVPGSTFTGKTFCRLSISESGEMQLLGDGKVKNKEITKKFKQEDCPVSVRMVIILPNKDVYKKRETAVRKCAQACADRGVSWVSIYKYDVTWANLNFLLKKPSVRYVYWVGHGNNEIGGVLRTHNECWKLIKEGWVFDDWERTPVFSWTGDAGNPLPNNWDTRGYSLWSLSMHDEWNKKIVFIDTCLSATYTDMAQAYGMFSLQGQGSLDQIYIGWRRVAESDDSMLKFMQGTSLGVEMFWDKMGDYYSVQQALEHTATTANMRLRTAMWGDNQHTDLGDVEGDDNIFVWGLGFVNLNSIRLIP